MVKRFFWFVVGWFLSIFATHNYGWEPTIKTGWILLGMYVFFAMILGVDKEDDVVHAISETEDKK